ncbi:hypothetical protein CA85_21750 [Allorhodopirellula solitaria]|uniref:Uncharacterized protein n=1 Tax=Allorhodopirellula solitaria TaxID=2527987 RepID=A0A5C5XZE7_9BACT|nr:hypothetical protein CA85_21750 [Allorhodopirellula solitaria]
MTLRSNRIAGRNGLEQEWRGLKQVDSSFTGICFRFRPACPGGAATASYLQNALARSISAPDLSRRNQRSKSCDRRDKPETEHRFYFAFFR